MNNILLTKYKY